MHPIRKIGVSGFVSKTYKYAKLELELKMKRLIKLLFGTFFNFALVCLASCNPGTGQVKSNIPVNPKIPKPDEIYISNSNHMTRVRNDSPWFNIFWNIADQAVKADPGSNLPIGVRAFIKPGGSFRLDEKESKSNRYTRFVGGTEKKFKPGETIKHKEKLEFSTKYFRLGLWYDEPFQLVIPADRVAENHAREVAESRWPIEKGGVHRVRSIILNDRIPGSSMGGYFLILESKTEWIEMNGKKVGCRIRQWHHHGVKVGDKYPEGKDMEHFVRKEDWDRTKKYDYWPVLADAYRQFYYQEVDNRIDRRLIRWLKSLGV